MLAKLINSKIATKLEIRMIETTLEQLKEKSFSLLLDCRQEDTKEH